MGAAPIRPRLREATARLHEELDRRLVLLDPGLTLPRYREILAGLLGYYVPLEERLAQRQIDYPLGIPPWSARLREDLAACSLASDAMEGLPRCELLPALDGRARLAGVLYVLEGAALGGQFIASVLRQRLGLAQERGLRFFASEGAGTGQRWKRFLAWLESEAEAASPRQRQQMEDAACETFATMADWLQRSGALL